MSRVGAGAFTRGGALALVAGGFALFLALIWLLGSGAQFLGNANDGEAHASAKGLNGYAALVRLAEETGFAVERSRSPAGLETEGLLVLTPPPETDPLQLAKLLKKREEIGPTLVILPKWVAMRPPPDLPEEARDKFEPGWVMLEGSLSALWSESLPAPYGFKRETEELKPDEAPGWEGFDLAGSLPTRTIAFASEESAMHEPLVTDSAGHWLALRVIGQEGTPFYENAHWTVFVAEPDLLNNYGLADKTRAEAAIALLQTAAYDGDIDQITFDLTLNGFGASENLLTLAFRPPFLAATLCLLLALLIIGWRAFQRFGPAAAAGPEIAFGKQRLIANGASLILRARRLHLLGAPYAALTARRLAERLGLPRAEPAAIDAALARRLPNEEPFSRRAARLEGATKPADILGAAQALDDLTQKL